MATLEIIKDCGENYKYQGPRFSKLGPESGDEFRDKYLIPWLEKTVMPIRSRLILRGLLYTRPHFWKKVSAGQFVKGIKL